MRISATGATDVGREREGNEDSFLIDESIGLYIVCDGMGGHSAGEVASKRSIAFVAEYIRDRQSLIENAATTPGGYFRIAEMVEEAIQFASAKLHELGASSIHYRGMGTTMTLLLVVDTKAIMGHVGDSRLYLFRDDNVHQLSTDHTWANELVTLRGLPTDCEEVARYSHVLTRAIGTQQSVEVEALLFDLFPDDLCLICSDGLSNYFVNPAMLRELIDPLDLSATNRDLIEFAKREGGADNITAVTVAARSDDGETHSETVEIRERLKLLKSSFLCKNMSENRMMRVLNHSAAVSASADQELIRKGDEDSGAYIVRRGRVMIELLDGSVAEVGEHDSFGETSLTSAGNVIASATTIEDTDLLFISRKRFDSLSRRFPKLGRQLYKNLANELCRRYCVSLSESMWGADTLIEPEDE